MKKITLLFVMFIGALTLNAQVVDVDWAAGTPTGWPVPANDITVPSPWTVTGEQKLDFVNWGGSDGIRFYTADTSGDLWLAYHATGLTIGVDYKIEATLRTQNDKVDMTLYAWPESEGNSPSGVTVVGSPLPGFVDNADGAYSVTFEATSASMVFGVGVNRNGGTPGSAIRNFKVTEVSTGPSTETDILTFTLPEQTSEATIDATAHTVAIEVAFGTDLTSLTPAITLSANATVNPLSGVAQDFSNPVVYSVTAEDATTMQDWTVTVTEAVANTETDIVSFILAEQSGTATIDSGAHTVSIEVVNGTSLASLTPTIGLSNGATVSPLSGEAQDFSSGAIDYTVTAQDNTTTEVWSVTVTEAAPSADVFKFNLENQTESDAFMANLPNGFSTTGTVSSNQFGGTYGVKIERNSSLNYSVTGLAAGEYSIEGVIMVQNKDNLSWIQDVWASGGTVSAPILQDGTSSSFVTYTETVTVPTTGDYTFGIVRANDGGQFVVKSWKATYLGPTLSSNDVALENNFTVLKTGVKLKNVSGHVQIIDLAGRVLVSKNMRNQETFNYNFNPATIYMVKLSTKEGSVTKKVAF
ncbi:T9SS type A sorting domain-containing protein [Tamlana sp. I1]|uniref:T9SS type A sorting domain-containing protein n=1 Tax=Tamlana sp. I1 TaxID=2762061 RepID=UPI00188FDEE1|nr:T9SS type A sorting domain-containing protein [Tamlana sp. I1]